MKKIIFWIRPGSFFYCVPFAVTASRGRSCIRYRPTVALLLLSFPLRSFSRVLWTRNAARPKSSSVCNCRDPPSCRNFRRFGAHLRFSRAHRQCPHCLGVNSSCVSPGPCQASLHGTAFVRLDGVAPHGLLAVFDRHVRGKQDASHRYMLRCVCRMACLRFHDLSSRIYGRSRGKKPPTSVRGARQISALLSARL